MEQTRSSPNRTVRAYASVARSLAQLARTAEAREQGREKAAAATIMAVASIETYLNIFGRLWIAQNPNFEHRERIEADLRSKKALGRKLEEWPELFFGRRLDFGSGPGQRFKVLLERRNRLMHFSSDSHRLEFENVVIHGMLDTSVYNGLVSEDGWNAVLSAEEFLAHLLELQDIPREQVPHAMHHWLGVPAGAV